MKSSNQARHLSFYLGTVEPVLTLIWVGREEGFNGRSGRNGRSCNHGILQHSVKFQSQSPDIGQNSSGVISDFRIYDQSLIKENCHNSRISDDIDMKLGPVIKLDKRNKKPSKNFDDDVMSVNCEVIVIFLIYG